MSQGPFGWSKDYKDLFQETIRITRENGRIAAETLRKSLGKLRRKRHGEEIEKEELMKLGEQVIDWIWSPRLPYEERQMARFFMWSEFSKLTKPQRKFAFSKRKPIPVPSPPQVPPQEQK